MNTTSMQAQGPPSSPVSPTTLQPPRASIEDPGAHELESSENEDDHFSDASEGRQSGAQSPSRSSVTEVNRRGSAGQNEGPRTKTYGPRDSDSAPGSVAPAGAESVHDSNIHGPPVAETVIPKTVVEKVDPFTASYGEVPGTVAYEMRRADAEPDVVVGTEDQEVSRGRSSTTPGNLPVPITKVSRVDTSPSHGEVPGTDAYEKHKEDAKPDVIEQEPDPDEVGPVHRSSIGEGSGLDSIINEHDMEQGFDKVPGDDFDDFAEGEVDEDFGEFDDGFADDALSRDDGMERVSSHASQSLLAARVPLLEYSALNGPDEVMAATCERMDEIFPWDREVESASVSTLPDGDSIFITERSLSLWSQLVAAPPLQPPNWVRSRIRRLFLVSLGVPVDLDEILPASKQKKLVLPSLQKQSEPSLLGRTSGTGDHNAGSESLEGNRTRPSASSDSRQASPGPRRRNGPASPPELDLAAARMLCGTTEAALSALSAEDLQMHVQRVEELRQRAMEVLAYWLKRKDGALEDKEAFEGVIENLVKHARRVRK